MGTQWNIKLSILFQFPIHSLEFLEGNKRRLNIEARRMNLEFQWPSLFRIHQFPVTLLPSQKMQVHFRECSNWALSCLCIPLYPDVFLFLLIIPNAAQVLFEIAWKATPRYCLSLQTPMYFDLDLFIPSAFEMHLSRVGFFPGNPEIS